MWLMARRARHLATVPIADLCQVAFPILVPVQNADDQDPVYLYDINDHVSPVSVQSLRRLKFEALPRYTGIVRQQIEGRDKPLVVSLSLVHAELGDAAPIDLDNVQVASPRCPVRH